MTDSAHDKVSATKNAFMGIREKGLQQIIWSDMTRKFLGSLCYWKWDIYRLMTE